MVRRYALVVAVLVVTGAASCTGAVPVRRSGTVQPPVSLRAFDGGGVSFRFPASWTAHQYVMPPSTIRSVFVYLSNDALHNPCQGTGSGMTCAYPIDRLGADGVLVTWSENGSPAWTFKSFREAAGRRTTIGGRPAKVLIGTSGRTCASIGADELIEVVVPNGRYNWYEMDACIRGPNLGAAEAQVTAMLRTVQFG